MTKSRAAKIFAISAGAGVMAAPLAFATPAAFAATDCGTGTEVSTGICEQAFTTAGDFSFTAPAGVSKVSAIIVGAGGGAATYGFEGAYGGGGGEVVFVDFLEESATLSGTVGVGGAIADALEEAQAGGDTTFASTTAAGGSGATFNGGGESGSGEAGSSLLDYLGAGGGAGGTTSDCVAGPGLTASAAASGSSLFPATSGEAIFGAGGSCSDVNITSFTGTAGSGGSVSGLINTATAEAGEDGAVIIRWAGAALPDTGLNVQPWMIGAGVATVAAGALFASGVLRTRRQGRHSA